MATYSRINFYGKSDDFYGVDINVRCTNLDPTVGIGRYGRSGTSENIHLDLDRIFNSAERKRFHDLGTHIHDIHLGVAE